MIFAIDFDDTIATECNGRLIEIPGAIDTIKQLQNKGHKIIIWTCRNTQSIAIMSMWLNNMGLIPDAINDNIEGIVGWAKPKVYADVYIDDRNYPPFDGWDNVRHKYCK